MTIPIQLTVEAINLADEDDVFTAAMRLAKLLKICIKYRFNGQECAVYPDGSVVQKR